MQQPAVEKELPRVPPRPFGDLKASRPARPLPMRILLIRCRRRSVKQKAAARVRRAGVALKESRVGQTQGVRAISKKPRVGRGEERDVGEPRRNRGESKLRKKKQLVICLMGVEVVLLAQ